MASSSRSRATPSRPVGKTQRTRGGMTSKQTVQGILSVKEMTSELEKTKRNEVLLKTRIRSVRNPYRYCVMYDRWGTKSTDGRRVDWSFQTVAMRVLGS